MAIVRGWGLAVGVPVNISYDGDGRGDVNDITFPHKNFFDFFTYRLENFFTQQFPSL